MVRVFEIVDATVKREVVLLRKVERNDDATMTNLIKNSKDKPIDLSKWKAPSQGSPSPGKRKGKAKDELSHPEYFTVRIISALCMQIITDALEAIVEYGFDPELNVNRFLAGKKDEELAAAENMFGNDCLRTAFL